MVYGIDHKVFNKKRKGILSLGRTHYAYYLNFCFALLVFWSAAKHPRKYANNFWPQLIFDIQCQLLEGLPNTSY